VRTPPPPASCLLFNIHRHAARGKDLVQHIFLRILQYRHSFRGKGAFKNCMFPIARNVNEDVHRKRKIRTVESDTELHNRRIDDSPTWSDQPSVTERIQ